MPSIPTDSLQMHVQNGDTETETGKDSQLIVAEMHTE